MTLRELTHKPKLALDRWRPASETLGQRMVLIHEGSKYDSNADVVNAFEAVVSPARQLTYEVIGNESAQTQQHCLYAHFNWISR